MSILRQIVVEDGYNTTFQAKCSNCAYFDAPCDCRRHAPVYVHDSKAYPRVDYDHWCGDWEPGIGMQKPVKIYSQPPKEE